MIFVFLEYNVWICLFIEINIIFYIEFGVFFVFDLQFIGLVVGDDIYLFIFLEYFVLFYYY